MKITIDAGHAWNGNPYPPVKGHYEGTQMYKLSVLEKEELEQYGIDVVLTRPNLHDYIDSVVERGRMAAQNGSDLMISNHSNACGTPSVSYTAVYYSKTDPTRNKPFADGLSAVIAKTMGNKNEGGLLKIEDGADFYGVIRGAAQNGLKQAFMIEQGFHTNTADAKWLCSDANLKKLAKAVADYIAIYYGLKKQTSEKQLYRVQTGAFKEKENAESLAKELKRKGFDTYIVTVDGWYKVQVGAYAEKANATAMMKKLQDAGYEDAYITYNTSAKPVTTAKKSVTEIAKEVIEGHWGNGTARRTALENAGYNYSAVQDAVNKLLD